MVNSFSPHVVFDPHTTKCLISADGWVLVDFAYCTLGPGWEACYTPLSTVDLFDWDIQQMQ